MSISKKLKSLYEEVNIFPRGRDSKSEKTLKTRLEGLEPSTLGFGNLRSAS